jgi:putative selenium metabolism hydrolase
MTDVLDTARRQQVVDVCRSLVQIQSHAGDEQAVIERVREWMVALGYADIRVDECGNVIGALYGGDGPLVLYDSHVDIVPAADADHWRYPPYAAEVVDDRIYGRGSSDMKGALAAALVGLSAAHADGRLRGTVLVSATVGEEHIEGLAMGHVVDHYRPDLVVICESTALKLNIAQRGRAEIQVTVHGKSAHASNPAFGINALRNMTRLVAALDTLLPPSDSLLGDGILVPTTIISSPYPNVSVIPFRCDARYDRRTLVGESAESVLAPIHEIINQLAQDDPAFRAEASIVPGEFVCYTSLKLTQETFAPAWKMHTNDAWVQAAQHALGDVELGHYSFCTNGSYSLGRKGIPTLGYGPGYEHSAHTTDEYLELAQLFGAAEGYYRLGGLAL